MKGAHLTIYKYSSSISRFLPKYLETINIPHRPDDTAEDDDEDDEDKQRPGGHRDDDGQLLRVRHVDAGVGEGQGHVALGHAAIVDGHAGILTQVRGGHTGHRQTEVPLNAA